MCGAEFFDGCVMGKKSGRAGQGGEAAADGTQWAAVTGLGGGAAPSQATTAPCYGHAPHERGRNVPVKWSFSGSSVKMAVEGGGRDWGGDTQQTLKLLSTVISCGGCLNERCAGGMMDVLV